MKRLQASALLFVALALTAAACSSSSSTSTSSTSTSSSSAGSGGGGGASSASIVASGLAFHPNAVDVSAGTVTLTVTNDDSTLHSFTLDDGSSTTDLPPGQTQTITLDLTKTVSWHCRIHPTMTGTLNVA